MVPIGDSGQAATPKVGWLTARMNGANMSVAPAVVAFTLVLQLHVVKRPLFALLATPNGSGLPIARNMPLVCHEAGKLRAIAATATVKLESV